MLNLPITPKRFSPVSSSVLPKSHSLKLSFWARIPAPKPKIAPPIGPIAPNERPKRPELLIAPNVIAPTPAPIPSIPASFPPDALLSLADFPNLPNIPFTVFTSPLYPDFSSPNMNFLNMSDFNKIDVPTPRTAPARGPPTSVPSIPP